MTDEQAVLADLAKFPGIWETGIFALLDAKDAEYRMLAGNLDKICHGKASVEARAEQAETERDLLSHQMGEALHRAALAEERKAHQAFRVEVSQLASWVKINLTDLILGDVSSISYPTRFSTRTVERLASNCRKYLPDLSHFILPAKPVVDPLVAVLKECDAAPTGTWAKALAANLRAAIERAGGTISFEGDG